jgi:predicted GTPase
MRALSAAVEAAAEMVPAADLAPAAEIARAAETRHGFLGDTVVVALAGGTGSGKSSLLNALAGHKVSTVGAVRPTTAEPLAWIPANPEPGLVRLLDELGLDRRVGHSHELPVAVIDLPDYDSVEFEHRVTVESLLPRVDAVIWVLDPQKYSDRALHRDYLIPLAGYADQFLFVLNQIDRLDEAGLEAVLEDLTRRLASEGFAAPHLVTTAVSPATGKPLGLDTLVVAIADRFESKRVAHAKLVADARRSHELLVGVTLAGTRPAVISDELWDEAEDAAVGALTDLVAGPAVAERAEQVGERLATSRAAGPIGRLGALLRRSRLGRALGAAPDEVTATEWWAKPGLERVVGNLNRTVVDVSTGLSGELGRRLRSDLTPERLETEIRAAVEGARDEAGALDAPSPKWWWGLVGGLQLLLFMALVGGVAWVWVDGVDRGEVPWNIILITLSSILAVGVGFATRWSGRRAGRGRARRYRADIQRALETQLQGRVGVSLAEAFAVQERVAGSLERLESAIGEVELGTQ